MALTPDTPTDGPNEAFLREVDENLRRDQLEGFARAYGKWLIAAVVLFLAAVAAWLYWQNRQQEKAAEQTEQLIAAYTDAGQDKTDAARKQLQALASADNDTVRALAMLAEAAIALDANDRSSAITKYRTVSADAGVPDPMRDAALVRLTTLEFDKLKPQDVIARMEPLAKPGEPWFGSAGELTAMAYLKQGQKAKAGQLLAAIAKDTQVPPTLRSRAGQMAGTLGVDASAALQQFAQPGIAR